MSAPRDLPPTLAARVRACEPGVSWEQARELCRTGRVLVDGFEERDAAVRPRPDAAVEVLTPAAVAARYREAAGAGSRQGSGPAGGPAGGLVVYADADVAVVRKPAGILTVPFERGDRGTLLALARVELRRWAARREGAGAANPTLRAVQRLDKETSGLVVFARSVAAQRHLQAQLAERLVTREYQALAHGAARDAVYDTWLVADRGDGLRGSLPWPAEAVAAPPAGARQAVTRVRVLARLRGATHLACGLETGRQHQIRIHLAEAGHPLVGETVYIRDYRGQRIAAPRPMLHAAVLGFLHPRGGKPLRFAEPPPADFARLLASLGGG